MNKLNFTHLTQRDICVGIVGAGAKSTAMLIVVLRPIAMIRDDRIDSSRCPHTANSSWRHSTPEKQSTAKRLSDAPSRRLKIWRAQQVHFIPRLDTGEESVRETADHVGVLGKARSGAVFTAGHGGHQRRCSAGERSLQLRDQGIRRMAQPDPAITPMASRLETSN